MDLEEMIHELEVEKQRIQDAVEVLRRLQRIRKPSSSGSMDERSRWRQPRHAKRGLRNSAVPAARRRAKRANLLLK